MSSVKKSASYKRAERLYNLGSDYAMQGLTRAEMLKILRTKHRIAQGLNDDVKHALKGFLGQDFYADNPASFRGTSRPRRNSQITKAKPTKRLVSRRTKNTEQGYFPNPADPTRDAMLYKMLDGALSKARAAKKSKDYSRVNGYLGYAQGILETIERLKIIDADTLKQYKSVIKGMTT